MSKISQGKYEIFTTKADAINKFMKLQGICRQNLSEKEAIRFYCDKKGEILITNPPSRDIRNDNSTTLSAQVLEEGGKTYVTYYTRFDESNRVLKLVFLAIYFLMLIGSGIFIIFSENKINYLPMLILSLILLVSELRSVANEKANSPKDSEILIEELERKVEAVNLWDK